VDTIEQLSARGGGMLDLDTVASSGSFEAALHAAGGAVRAVDALLDGVAGPAFCALRPPGHHAEASRAMGFCLFNNVAVAARHALDRHGVERVLVLDWDVHHGNGTNDIFYASREVLYASIHQSPLYPGTGALGESGAGEGEGHTINLPVPPGSGHDEWLSLVQRVVVPAARAYEPGLVLVSAGFDAHRDDPLASCALTEETYAAMAATMRDLARELGVPLAIVLEGGYDLDALARSVSATMAAASGDEAAEEAPAGPLVERARSHFARWWAGLA
jgi:acetoin utilization deacetylase AcuC-like enzyme